MRVTASAALVGCLLLAACGGDRRDPSGKEQFMAAADEICSRFPGPLVESDSARANTGSGAARGSTFANRVSRFAEAVDRGVVSLEHLELPRGAERAAAQEFVDEMTRLGESVVRLKAATDELAASDPTDIARMGGEVANVGMAGAELDRRIKGARRNARDYGLSTCDRVL